MAIKSDSNLEKRGFTIVELIIVIAVIGILAAITVLSFSGVLNKVNANVITSDLIVASSKFKKYYADHGLYPASLNSNYCPLDASSSVGSNYCLVVSSDVSLNYTGGDQYFTLIETRKGLSYEITEGSAPTLYNPITGIGAITGTVQVSQVLTVGNVSPLSATVTYQWQSSTTSGGTYTNISGATNGTYILTSGDWNRYIKVVATGTGDFTGAQTSAATVAVSDPTNWSVIGSQTWAKANLNVGTMIAGAYDQANNAIPEKYCYNDSTTFCDTYGGLYQWSEAMQYGIAEGAQGLCPAGSHIPSDNDWKLLEIQLGLTQGQADATGWRGTNQGTQLKVGGASGLNIPIAGYRNNSGLFYGVTTDGYMWSSSDSGTYYPMTRYLIPSNAAVNRNNSNGKNLGFSVRCVAN